MLSINSFEIDPDIQISTDQTPSAVINGISNPSTLDQQRMNTADKNITPTDHSIFETSPLETSPDQQFSYYRHIQWIWYNKIFLN